MRLFCILGCMLAISSWGGRRALAEDSFIPADQAQSRFVDLARRIDTGAIAALPVQNNGRIKPLDSLAREAIVFMTGKYGMWGLSPLQIYLGLMLDESSSSVPLIEVRDPELRRDLGLAAGRRFFSAVELQTTDLENQAAPLSKKEESNSKSLSSKESKILETYRELMLSRAVAAGNHFFTALDFSSRTDMQHGAETGTIQQAAERYLRALSAADREQARMSARELIELVNAYPLPDILKPYRDTVKIEVFYNQARLFLIAAIAYLLIAILILIPQTRAYLGRNGVLGLLAIPVSIHALGFGLRVYISRFAPVTNMYGTMLWVSFGVALFSAVLYFFYRQAIVVGLLLVASASVLLLTHNLPLILSPDMDPIVAVLRSNFWLTTHVLTITISYAAFTVAMVLGNTGLVANLIGVRDAGFYKRYAHFTYRMIQLGVFLISAGIILGGIWADYSWGRFWGWDPKETWALIADLGFLMILHARYVGWLRDFGLLASSAAAYLLVIMAWYGVNFVLAAGLHSYGFSSGGATFVAIFVSTQVALLAASLLIRRYTAKISAVTM
ncbi:MAG: cytochrome c biogenesis protein CcsA [Oligoflexia bacterium]|nr:cytochrome c biogenesis protein CcsA [Oligoflexia bacterium]